VLLAGCWGGMASPESQVGASGGGAALRPALAGYGRYEGLAAAELPKPLVNKIPVPGSLCLAPQIVRANDVFGHAARDRWLRAITKNFALWSG
jgi:hypothetical protein